MKLWKYSGTYLTATGILHTIAGLIMANDVYRSMLREGLINTIKGDFVRASGFWFLICGIFLILSGTLLQYYIKATQKPAPNFFGYWLLIFAIFGCIVVPASGFWLFIPQGLIIILANRKFSEK